MITIYSKEKISKVLHTINLTKEEFDEYIKDPFVDVPHLDKEKCVVIYDKPIIKYPTFDEALNDIREMTREEVCQTGDLSILGDGEKYEDGHIIQVPNPSTDNIKYTWNREKFIWELVTTKEELMLRRVDLIMEYNDLKNKITTLEELREFESTETIELLREKMNKIKEEADMLLEKIKKLK